MFGEIIVFYLQCYATIPGLLLLWLAKEVENIFSLPSGKCYESIQLNCRKEKYISFSIINSKFFSICE